MRHHIFSHIFNYFSLQKLSHILNFSIKLNKQTINNKLILVSYINKEYLSLIIIEDYIIFYWY